jgi:ribosomal protein S12 methylthiotransferase
LVGQDTTFYGEDLGLRDGLALLLERLASVAGLAWVRFLYCYPNRITPRLLETIAAHPRLAKYIDMPLQHASRDVLARMKRGSNADAFLRLLERIRRTIPGVALRTSFIVGFPGETEADFRELCGFVRAAEFDWMGVFRYSDVDNAASFALDGKVVEDTIQDRQQRLMEIQQKISSRKLRRFRGNHATALVEGPSKDTPLVWEARLESMAPEIDGKLYLNDIEAADAGRAAQAGDLVTVEITETHEYDLVGRVVEILDAPRPAAPLAAAAGPVQRVATGAALRILA